MFVEITQSHSCTISRFFYSTVYVYKAQKKKWSFKTKHPEQKHVQALGRYYYIVHTIQFNKTTAKKPSVVYCQHCFKSMDHQEKFQTPTSSCLKRLVLCKKHEQSRMYIFLQVKIHITTESDTVAETLYLNCLIMFQIMK